MRPAIPIAVIAGLLLLWVFWPQSSSKERVVIEPGVSLQENRKAPTSVDKLWSTPLTPSWKNLLLRLREDGWRGRTNGPLSGLREHGDQKKLWLCFQRGRCAPAFHPRGPSRHLRRNVRRWGQWSQAIDVSNPEGLVRRARRMGVPLWVPYKSEPWHIEALSVWSLPPKTVLRVRESGRPRLLLIGALLAGVFTLLWQRGWLLAQVARLQRRP